MALHSLWERLVSLLLRWLFGVFLFSEGKSRDWFTVCSVIVME